MRAFMNPEPVRPMREQGVAGFAVYGGYVQSGETNPKLYGQQKWQTAADIVSNVSIVAAGVRFMLNLIARPAWSWQPADESAAAQEAAEFMQEITDDLDASWTRVVRRLAMYKFNGFGAHEWIAYRRDDGLIGIKSIEPRPCHTIKRWDLDDAGLIRGLIQEDPQTSAELYLPRGKLLYLVDDALTDRPDGLGWFRHLVEPAEALKSLLALEKIGFERDLRGIPVGRAPYQLMNKLVTEGKLTEQQRDSMIKGMEEFVTLQRKTSETGLVLDSKPYENKTENGTSTSSALQWGLELISGEPGSMEEIASAVKRLEFNMALIIGTEVMLTGREGEGSRALSEDKSRNLYLNAQSILWDIAEGVDRDIRDPIWAMNGLPDELKPTASPEDVSFKDAQKIAETLAEMASAGAVLAPDDEAIDTLRDMLGLPPARPFDNAMLGAMNGVSPGGDDEDPENPSGNEEVETEEGEDLEVEPEPARKQS